MKKAKIQLQRQIREKNMGLQAKLLPHLYLVLVVMLKTSLGDSSSAQTMYLTKFDRDRIGTKCLDGSPAGYYYSPPPNGESKTWIIRMKGGGNCVTQEECINRTTTGLGSSENWSNTYDPSNSILSDNSNKNPDFYDAHHVYIPYCSGDLHSGQRITNSSETYGFYFNGHLIFKNIISDLAHETDNHASILDASHILLTGNSAGGYGTMANINWLYEKARKVCMIHNSTISYVGTFLIF